jgi:hypothetical protein
MPKIRAMRVEDVETVAKMDALDHDRDPERGYREAKQHTLDHLEIVPQHCYVVENNESRIIGAMVLHPRKELFEIKHFESQEIAQKAGRLERLLSKYVQEQLA